MISFLFFLLAWDVPIRWSKTHWVLNKSLSKSISKKILFLPRSLGVIQQLIIYRKMRIYVLKIKGWPMRNLRLPLIKWIVVSPQQTIRELRRIAKTTINDIRGIIFLILNTYRPWPSFYWRPRGLWIRVLPLLINWRSEFREFVIFLYSLFRYIEILILFLLVILQLIWINGQIKKFSLLFVLFYCQ